MTFEELYNRFPRMLRLELESCIQDSEYHPEGSVTDHMRIVFNAAVENFPEDTDMHLAALFHDLGKPETKGNKIKPTGYIRVTHYGHEYKAEKFIDEYIDLFLDLNPNIKRIKAICRGHMRAHLYLDGRMSREHKRKKFEEEEFFKDIVNFSEKCDVKNKGNIS